MSMTIPKVPSLSAGYVMQLADLQALANAATFALTKPMASVIDETGSVAIGTSPAPVQFTDAIFDTDGMWGESLLGQNTGFESGIGTWVAAGNCSLSDSAAQAHTGVDSLALTSAAAGNMGAVSCSAATITTNGMPVVAGALVPISAWFRSAVSARSCNVGIDFYNASGGLISTLRGANITDSTTGWTQARATLTAPAASAFCRASPQVLATGAASEVHYVDDVVMAPYADRLIVQTPGWYKVRYGINPGVVGGVYTAWATSTTGANNPSGAGVTSSPYWSSCADLAAATFGWCRGAGVWPFFLYAGDYIQVSIQAAATGSSTGIGSPTGSTLGGSYFSLEYVSTT